MPPPFILLTATPSNLVFGNVVEETTSPSLSVLLTNNSSINYTFYLQIVPSDSRFVYTGPEFITIPPGPDYAVTLNFTFVAGVGVGTVSATYATVVGELIPIPFTLTATTIAGSTSWNITPNIWNFGPLELGFNATNIFSINNTDPVLSLTITSVTANDSEFSVTGLPALPFNIAHNASQSFTVECIAAFKGNVNYPNGVTVVGGAGEGQVVLQLGYTGQAITPAFVLTGATKGVLFGFGGQWNNAQKNLIAQSLASLACEAPASLTKMVDFGNPSAYTYANRVFMRIDPLGAVTVTLQNTGVISEQFTTVEDIKSRIALSTDALNIPDELVFDAEQNSEIHMLQFSVAAGGGILSIQNIIPAFEPRGSVYESA
jgi:hypothetical protein